MNFLQITSKFILVDADNTEATLLTFHDPSDNDAVIVNWEEEASQAVFDANAPIEFFADGNVGVTDREGDVYTFTAYVRQKVALSDDPRAIDLSAARIENTEPNRLWVKVGKFDVLLNHTEEGIVVDVWPWVAADAPILPDEPLATCYAFDADADEALEHESD